MEKKIGLLLLVTWAIVSCGRTNKLSEEDYAWMPYEGNEMLVFKANTGETDTIFCLKKDTLMAYPEAQSLNGTRYEVVSVFCKHSDPYAADSAHRYLEGRFMEIAKNANGRATINIHFSASNAKFYRSGGIVIDSIGNMPPVQLETTNGRYNDVYIFEPQDVSEDNNYVARIYWSKSKGLVRYDKKGNIYWELISD